MLEDALMDRKMSTIKELRDHLGRLGAMEGDQYGLAVHVYDRELTSA